MPEVLSKAFIDFFMHLPIAFFFMMFQKIHFDLELDPVKLLGGVEVFRSLTDKKKGPKFYLHAKRNPLEAEVRKLWHAKT